MDDGSGGRRRTLPGAGEDVSLESIPLHSTNLLTLLDEDGVVRYESPSIERIFGFRQDEVVGEQVAGYFHPEDRDEVVGAFEAVVAGDGGVEAVEYRHLKADGSYCWVESVASSNPTPEGYYVVNTRDISDQKSREIRLREANERLEEFASVVSHDLRSPLLVARGRLELALEEGLDGHVDAIERAHGRMDELVQELLVAAHGEGGGSDPQAADLRSVIVDCWENVDAEDATLRPPDSLEIYADKSGLQQLLENLFRNAVDQREDVTVTVGACGDGFYVEDDGPGIPESEREKVFETGYSSSEDGLGFGLRIVERVAESHGWEVDVDEGAGGGAKFEFSKVEFVE